MKKKETEQNFNIAFVGRKKNLQGELVEMNIPESVTVGRTVINIPKVGHGEGFYLANASLLINSSNNFKAFKPKGE